MEVRKTREKDFKEICDILFSLLEWFDENARKAIPVDLQYQKGFVAVEDGKVVGFVTYYVAEGAVVIGWMGVRKEFHRKGIGSRLLARLVERTREMGIGRIATYTLGDSVKYAPYERTRQFYFKHGFRVYQRSKTDNPSCPEEIRLKLEIASFSVIIGRAQGSGTDLRGEGETRGHGERNGGRNSGSPIAD